MSESESSNIDRIKAYFALAFIIAGFLSLSVRPEQARICEVENGLEYFVAECEHQFLFAKLFYPSYCSVSYKSEGGVRMSSFSEPAKRISDDVYEFTASKFMTFDPDIQIFDRGAPLLVRVYFDNYLIEVRGDITGRFVQCRRGNY